jgi:hypothetical protein
VRRMPPSTSLPSHRLEGQPSGTAVTTARSALSCSMRKFKWLRGPAGSVICRSPKVGFLFLGLHESRPLRRCCRPAFRSSRSTSGYLQWQLWTDARLAAPFVVIFVVAIVASKGWINPVNQYFFAVLFNMLHDDWRKWMAAVATSSQQYFQDQTPTTVRHLVEKCQVTQHPRNEAVGARIESWMTGSGDQESEQRVA